MHASDRDPLTVDGHRATPDPDARVTATLLFGFFLVPLWLGRGRFLVNWDSVQYALGVESFDLTAHQPHPPGYIGYEWIGGVVAALVGDVPLALTLVSVVSGALAPAFLYLLARRMLPEPYALGTAILFGFSPMLWHYGGVALTYAPEVALSIPFVLLVHRADREGRLRDLIAAAIVFAALGSVRQSALLLLGPLWPLALRRFGPRDRVLSTGVLVAASLVWLLPLLQASGGFLTYVRESSDLVDLAVARTALSTASFTGVLQNVGILFVGAVVGLHLTPLLVLAARRTPGGSLGALVPADRRFLLIWAALPLLFFLLVHTGQPGYALLVLPIGYLWVGSALAQLVRYRHMLSLRARAVDGSLVRDAEPGAPAAAPLPERAATEPRDPAGPRAAAVALGPRRRQRLRRLVGGFSAAGLLTLVILPEATYRLVASEAGAAFQERMGLRSPADLNGARASWGGTQSPLATALRQYSTRRNDVYWGSLVEFIGAYPEGRTALLTGIGGPIASGSFRQLGYYLPEYRIYGVGWDRDGSFGHLFRTRGRESDYSVRGLRDAARTLALPEDVRLLVVPDADVAGLLDRASLETERWDLPGGASVTVARVPPGSVLELGNDDRQAHIRLRDDLARSGLADTDEAAPRAETGEAPAARPEAAIPMRPVAAPASGRESVERDGEGLRGEP